MRLLITGAWKNAKSFITKLENDGHTVIFMQQEADKLPCEPSYIEGVVCNGLFLHHDIRDFINLRFIQLTSAGFDRVPVDYIREKNIALFNARGVYSIPMAEHAVSAVLNVFRKSRLFYENQAEHIWKKERELHELFGSIVCIIGCGSVGSECAKRFAAFGCDTIGIDLKPFDSPCFSRVYGLEDTEKAISKADVIVLTLPLNAQTEGFVDRDFLSRLKPGCVLVNISRGKITDTQALIDALSEQDIYAALDVFDDEPLSSCSSLWDMKNVIITPHNSFVGDGNGERLDQLILRGIENG